MELKVAHMKRELCDKGITLSDTDSVSGGGGGKVLVSLSLFLILFGFNTGQFSVQ